jgi:hypothetical protein
VRRTKEPCATCGFEDTTARCVFCGKPVCVGCALPSQAGGPAVVKVRGRRGRVCSGRHEQQEVVWMRD